MPRRYNMINKLKKSTLKKNRDSYNSAVKNNIPKPKHK